MVIRGAIRSHASPRGSSRHVVVLLRARASATRSERPAGGSRSPRFRRWYRFGPWSGSERSSRFLAFASGSDSPTALRERLPRSLPARTDLRASAPRPGGLPRRTRRSHLGHHRLAQRGRPGSRRPPPASPVGLSRAPGSLAAPTSETALEWSADRRADQCLALQLPAPGGPLRAQALELPGVLAPCLRPHRAAEAGVGGDSRRSASGPTSIRVAPSDRGPATFVPRQGAGTAPEV